MVKFLGVAELVSGAVHPCNTIYLKFPKHGGFLDFFKLLGVAEFPIFLAPAPKAEKQCFFIAASDGIP